ncbi:MAG: hypothetical protein IPK82_24140 [Polyangiaceae bacterium]|nr:hypothetical protein [Polyangiaceae bacterium]
MPVKPALKTPFPADADGPLRAHDTQLQGLERLITRILGEPELVEKLFDAPEAVAEAAGIKLTPVEVKRIRAMPDNVRAKVKKWAGEYQASFVESLKEYKDDIHYLSQDELFHLHQSLLDRRLATWRYHGENSTNLGFVIDDQPASPAVAPDGRRVDLYRYISMAAAAIQVQEKEIAELKAEVLRLREKLG